jgi:hypothetical protein
LQFSKVQSKKIDMQTIQSAHTEPVDPLMPSLEGHSRKKAVLAILAASRKKEDKEKHEKLHLGILTEKMAGPRMDKMFPRGNDRQPELPVYMQNNNGRIAMATHMGRSLKDNSFQSGGFIDPRSTFLMRSDFRVDPLNQAKKLKRNAFNMNSEGKKKRSLTFN